ncbi:TIGR01244 family phosphatase [Ponticoccus sp. SC2-23]|uniref:TIGR01244 family sulfur transferase n=1 Tax=Alexandriicola marinus TaxID=2081710 RepID=UPI000FD86BC5|nr:TIGR01244 family sulfur transferase [Alexandriicola marinus]MBM1218944.1 TIGR01244 family phosphatase [Ponticoccus sp. SC6-9]MBM1223984.1 TIGR01244 family phosphatase [Ponticoccus sp. SC6-15]MBM1230237.1 TIGR01244 family phosphatase [Ponticoccus sp. SC6-38]MBM1232950.1 TIGR01244 family phosphatase [Ponticoccus sp. SC6-45]MBM1237100.1 TIGR01244 family phosphatase [Ponticoccus sp. SC6-49]MBM1241961.1 TIGR01244 family phosphatase [Ponticoccus sp. SC2-64]MBM1246474.1 TIGR01244 family phosphat
MDIKRITDDLSVSPQISAADMAALKAQGFGAIICNRPDGETPDQPDFAELAAAAKEAGLEARHIPVSGGIFSDEAVAAYAAALSELPGPILAYCRSGTRSATLWSLAQSGAMPLDDILSATSKAGYDMSGLADRIAARA